MNTEELNQITLQQNRNIALRNLLKNIEDESLLLNFQYACQALGSSLKQQRLCIVHTQLSTTETNCPRQIKDHVVIK